MDNADKKKKAACRSGREEYDWGNLSGVAPATTTMASMMAEETFTTHVDPAESRLWEEGRDSADGAGQDASEHQ